jgi:hypothetical protein
MVPSVDPPLDQHPDYEKGYFWYDNKYAVVTKRGNRNLR